MGPALGRGSPFYRWMSSVILDIQTKNATAAERQRGVENAVVRLLKERPFYGHFLLGCRRRLAAGTHAVGVTVAHGSPVLCIDPERFARLDGPSQQGLLEHGLKHLLHL